MTDWWPLTMKWLGLPVILAGALGVDPGVLLIGAAMSGFGLSETWMDGARKAAKPQRRQLDLREAYRPIPDHARDWHH